MGLVQRPFHAQFTPAASPARPGPLLQLQLAPRPNLDRPHHFASCSPQASPHPLAAMASARHRIQGRVHPSDAPDDAPPVAAPDDAAPSADLSRAASLRSLRSLKSQRSLVRRTSSLRRDTDDAAKGLLLPAEEHKAWLAARVRGEGRAAARALLRFYGRMLLPVAVAAAYTCAIAAGLSYSIPNLLCNRVAKENSVGEAGAWRLESGWRDRSGRRRRPAGPPTQHSSSSPLCRAPPLASWSASTMKWATRAATACAG